VRLVVVDSIAFHVRANSELTYAKRLQLVGQMAQLLSHAARRSPCAVVLINQVTTRVNEVLGTSGLVPALGEVWAHMCNMQVSLEWRDGAFWTAQRSELTRIADTDGDEVADMRHGIAVAALANVNRDHKRKREPFEAEDFIPWHIAHRTRDLTPDGVLAVDPATQAALVKQLFIAR
jgi:RecA/RadA recombinase